MRKIELGMPQFLAICFICIMISISVSTICIVNAINNLADAIENSPAVVINNNSTNTINNN